MILSALLPAPEAKMAIRVIAVDSGKNRGKHTVDCVFSPHNNLPQNAIKNSFGIFIHASSCMNGFYSLAYKITIVFIAGSAMVSCFHKQETPDLSQLVLSLKETGELITTEYTLGKVIRASDDQTWYKIGDRKILINCEANLKAGINLQALSEDDFQRKNDSSIVIRLPHAQLFSLSIPPDKIQVAYQETGTFRDPFTANEREQLVAQAEPQIKALVTSLRILPDAENNATVFIQHLFQQAGFKRVTVTYQ